MYCVSHPKGWRWEKNLFLARWPSHNLASFEVRAAKASCNCRGLRAWVLASQLRGLGEGWRQVAVSGSNERSKPQKFQKAVAAQKIKRSSFWRASLILRFKCISQILCVPFPFNFSPPGTTFPLHYFSFSEQWPSTSLKPQQSHRSVLIVTSVMGSRFLSSTKKEFGPKNSNARGSKFSTQSKSILQEKIWGGCSERYLGLLERKSQRQKWANLVKWTQETHYRGKRWAFRQRFTGLAWDELPLPAVPLVTSIMEIIRAKKKESIKNWQRP